MSVITANILVLNPNRVLPVADTVLRKIDFLVTLLQHRVVFFNKKNLQNAVTFESEAEPQLFLARS